jgi:hypothetical protein
MITRRWARGPVADAEGDRYADGDQRMQGGWLVRPDDDHAREAYADGYPEPDGWANSCEPPVELDAEPGE